MVRTTFLGHACFSIAHEGTTVLIDPFLTGNAMAAADTAHVSADYVLVTHGHGDHAGDAAPIAKRTGAAVVSSADICGALFSGLKMVAANLGGSVYLPFGSVKLIPAIHGSGVPGALACGFIVTIGGKKICHLGDTALTKDFELLADEGIDLLLAPIGDTYTMGPEDAARAAQMIRPALAVPMHYDTFPAIRQDPQDFVRACEARGVAARILAPGESLEI